MSTTSEIKKWKGKDVIELAAGTYTATIAPFLGSNIIRMQDSATGVDFFRNDDTRTLEEIEDGRVTWGFPTLYLPNRLSGGILKCSDHTYQFPINEPDFGNAIHGFLHLREHEIVSAESTATAAIAKTSYTYDQKDALFETFPVSFRADFTFTLDSSGMHYEFSKARLVSRLKRLREYCFFDLCTRCVATHCPPPLRSICSSRDIILMILSIALLFVIFDFFIVHHFNHSSFSKKHAIF